MRVGGYEGCEIGYKGGGMREGVAPPFPFAVSNILTPLTSPPPPTGQNMCFGAYLAIEITVWMI